MKNFVSSISFGFALVILLFSSSLLFSQENSVDKPSETVLEVEKKIVEKTVDKSKLENEVFDDKVSTENEIKIITTEKKKSELRKPLAKPSIKEKKVEAVKSDSKNVNSNFEKKYNGDGLLYIVDGEFRYSRIPGKKIPKVVENKIDDSLDDSVENSSEKGSEKTKGLFNLSESKSKMLAYGFLIFLVLMIFFMYRLRSRSNRR